MQSNLLAEPLVKIFNKSLETSDVPHDWQTAKFNVAPIFKKGNVVTKLRTIDQFLSHVYAAILWNM